MAASIRRHHQTSGIESKPRIEVEVTYAFDGALVVVAQAEMASSKLSTEWHENVGGYSYLCVIIFGNRDVNVSHLVMSAALCMPDKPAQSSSSALFIPPSQSRKSRSIQLIGGNTLNHARQGATAAFRCDLSRLSLCACINSQKSTLAAPWLLNLLLFFLLLLSFLLGKILHLLSLMGSV